MNPIDDQLDRLFRAAANVPPGVVPEVPFGLETRALAAWREGRTVAGSLWDIPILVRGLIVASVIMAVSFWPALSSTSTATSSPFADFLQLSDSTVSSVGTP